MSLTVIGAGVGRTGTLSLKAALEQILGKPCYHMVEVFGHPEHISPWRAAADGEKVDWVTLLDGFGATSDFPACLFWPELFDANPDAIVVLSTRCDSKTWWESARETIFALDGTYIPPEMSDWFEMWQAVASARFTPNWTDEAVTRAAYERHNAEVRASVPSGRLVEWQPGDGWGPLCAALDIAVPRDPFPHVNARQEFKKFYDEKA